ncbi:uncharacterized protein METZ01_LOCUS273957, partial [marine metagenome]
RRLSPHRRHAVVAGRTRLGHDLLRVHRRPPARCIVPRLRAVPFEPDTQPDRRFRAGRPVGFNSRVQRPPKRCRGSRRPGVRLASGHRRFRSRLLSASLRSLRRRTYRPGSHPLLRPDVGLLPVADTGRAPAYSVL